MVVYWCWLAVVSGYSGGLLFRLSVAAGFGLNLWCFALLVGLF